MSRRPHPTFSCPNCGAQVRKGASACRECGSDASTGWAEDADSLGVDLPAGYRREEDDEGFNDDYDDDGPAFEGDKFVKMTHAELSVMTPEQRKEYHRRSVLEGQIRAKKKRERQKVSARTVRPRSARCERRRDAVVIARHFTVFASA